MSIIDILLHIAAAVLGYVIGSVNAAVIITKYILKSDVRERGSKNAGAANVTRVFGPVAGGCTLLLDMAFMGVTVDFLSARWIGADAGKSWTLWKNAMKLTSNVVVVVVNYVLSKRVIFRKK